MADTATPMPAAAQPGQVPDGDGGAAFHSTKDTKISLRDMREKRAAKPEGDKPPAAAKPADAKPPVEAKPAVEDDDVDPDTAAEIDKLEAPAKDESAQSRSARRRKHREAARKALVTKAQNALKAANDELAEWRAGRRSAQAPPPANPGASPAKADAPASEFSRPKPTLKDFPLEKFKDEDDPFAAQGAALAEAVADWKVDQREHAAAAERHRDQANTDVKARLEAHGTREIAARAKYPDYDARLQAASFPKTPATVDLLDLAFGSEHSAEVLYHLTDPAKRSETLRLLSAPNKAWLEEAFKEVEGAVSASLAPKEPATRTVHAAEEPVQPVNSGAPSSGLLRDPLKDTSTRVSLRELRAHKQASRR